MRCSYCGKNEAESIVYMDYMGQKSEMYLYGECLLQMREYLNGIYKRFLRGTESSEEQAPGVPFAETSKDRPEGGSFPDDAGAEIRDRRRLGELKAQLISAVEREDYEQAAALRDEIARCSGSAWKGA